MRSHAVLLLSCVVSLGGCSVLQRPSAPRLPIPAQSEMKAFSESFSELRTANSGSSELAVLKLSLSKYHKDVYAKAVGRLQSRWENSDMITYGGLGAVAGSIAEKIALTNVGAAIAILGTVSSNQYQVNSQAVAYTTALRQISCISGKVNSVNDAELALAQNIPSDPATSAIARDFINTTVAAVDGIQQKYLDTLLGITPSVPSQAELSNHFSAFRPSSPNPSAGAPALISQAQRITADIATESAKLKDLENQKAAGVRTASTDKDIADAKAFIDRKLAELAQVDAQLKALANFAAQQVKDEIAKEAGARIKTLSSEIQNCSKV